MPPLTLQLDPRTLARITDDAVRIKCPACGGSCAREERAGTGAGRRVQVQCAYCEFGQLVEIPPESEGVPHAIDPEAMDREHRSFDDLMMAPRRTACLVGCGRLAAEGGFCEPCHRGWRIAGRPEPREAWAQHHADQLDADQAKSGTPVRARRSRPKPNQETDMPAQTHDKLTPNDKRRWSYVKKAVPGIDIETWVADGKPKPTHYRRAAKAAPKAPSKPDQPPAEPASATVPMPASPKPRPTTGETCVTPDPLVTFMAGLMREISMRGGRIRVHAMILTSDGESES